LEKGKDRWEKALLIDMLLGEVRPLAVDEDAKDP
jgi:hypothetical protein